VQASKEVIHSAEHTQYAGVELVGGLRQVGECKLALTCARLRRAAAGHQLWTAKSRGNGKAAAGLRVTGGSHLVVISRSLRDTGGAASWVL